MWHEYAVLFQRLKDTTNINLRKELRRNVENKRRQIMDADNVYVDKFLKDFTVEL